MNAELLPPFRLAQLLRQLADAREQNHPIAAAGPCPTSPPPSGFEHLRNGNFRCDFRPLPGLPPCTADGFVAVTNPARNNAPIFICCLEHLYHFHNPGQSYTASVSSNNPLARHYAFSLQAAQRQLRQSPDYDLSLDQQIQSLEGQIKRRLTPNPPPAPGRMSRP